MIKVRKSADRKHINRGWLDSRFTFSFADYQDPAQMGFRSLRVLNNDRIAPGKGFGPHAHRDMEILTYVMEGKLLHRDSMGEQHVLGPNEIQMMSAGSGVVHSEWNASETESCYLFQIWILPDAEDLQPAYQQIAFEPSEKHGRLRLLAAPDVKGDSTVTRIRQNTRVYAAELGAKETILQPLDSGRYAWVQVVKGNLLLNGLSLNDGDGVAVDNEAELAFAGTEPNGGEFLLFDLP